MTRTNSLERSYSISTPWGLWSATFSDGGLRELRLPEGVLKYGRHPGTGRNPTLGALSDQEGAAGRKLRKALDARLSGHAVDLPWELFDLSGRPPFFLKVWRVMYQIPFGQVCSYGVLAGKARSAKAVRAAGQACGANPVVLFIPCHRVVASSGLGGFGAGLGWKKRLLRLEGISLET